MKTLLLPVTCCFATLTAASAQGGYTIGWTAITGGAATSSNTGQFSLTGSVGQFAAGTPSGGAAGVFSLTGGYWTLEPSPMDLGLIVFRRGSSVVLTWDDSRGIPVVVEHSADLRTWTPVSPQPSGPSFTENFTAAVRRYYRLRRVIP